MGDKNNNATPTLASVIKQAFNNMAKDLHVALPGIIVSFDPITVTASVQPAIRRIFKTFDGDTEILTPSDLPVLINVPVVFPRGGGFSLTFPVTVGDECQLLFNERTIDNWHQKGGVQDPGAWRLHSLSDASCFVGLSSKPNVVSAYSATDVQLRNDDGDVTITLKPDKNVEIVTPVKVLVDTPNSQFTGNVQIDGNLSVDLDTQVDGSLNVDADVDVGGDTTTIGLTSSATMEATTSIKVAGTEMADHKHSQGIDSALDTQVDTGGPHA